MFTNYFKTAWRYLTRNKVSSVINILGLSLGVTCCLVIFLIARNEMGFDNFHPDKERIYRLTSGRGPEGNLVWRPGMLSPMLQPLRDDITGLEAVTTIFFNDLKVRVYTDQGEKYFEAPRPNIDPLDIVITDPAYFVIFQYEWLAGMPATLNQPNMVALTLDKAVKYFGEQPVDTYLGREITYGDSLYVSVAGIIQPWKKNTDFVFTDFISAASIPGSELSNRFRMEAWGLWDSLVQVYMKLAPGVEPATIEERLEAWSGKYIELSPNTLLKFSLQPLADIHFNAVIGETFTKLAHLPTLYGLMAIAVFILIIAACNFINMSTAQSLHRSKEIGMRKVLGGKRINLIAQLLGESLLVTIFAAFAALFLAQLTINVFQSFVPQGLTLGLTQPFTWLFLVAIILCTTLLAGMYPAKVISGAAPLTVMKGAVRQGSAKNLLRKSLIVFQFTISLVLIICTLIIGDQIHYLLNKDMGFNKDAIINIRINRIGENRNILAEKIRQFPYVETVSIHTAPPAAKGHNGTGFIRIVEGEDKTIDGLIEFCDENFIPLYDIQLVAGRNLLPSTYMKEVVVNEAFVRQHGFSNPQDALGEYIISGQNDRMPGQVSTGFLARRQLQIVGVAADFHLLPLYDEIGPMVISATTQMGRTLSVKLNTTGKSLGNVKQILADMERTWKEINPYERLELTFYDEAIAEFYEKEQKTAQIISGAMFMAIFISCLGLFGLVVFTTKQRTKEIGIRKVLGASVKDILMILSGGFVKLVLIASLIASPIAWYFMSNWLDGFAYRVPVHWWLFVLACLIALIITLATISLQTIKVAGANPVDAIKSE